MRPGSKELKVTYGIIPETDQELAMQTLSLLQIMIALATQIDVPSEHVEDGRTFPTMIPSESEEAKMGRLIQIHTAPNKPEGAFVSIKYKDYWFWINDRDFYSKRVFTFLMILFSLAESGGKQGLPLVTIPSG